MRNQIRVTKKELVEIAHREYGRKRNLFYKWHEGKMTICRFIRTARKRQWAEHTIQLFVWKLDPPGWIMAKDWNGESKLKTVYATKIIPRVSKSLNDNYLELFESNWELFLVKIRRNK